MKSKKKQLHKPNKLVCDICNNVVYSSEAAKHLRLQHGLVNYNILEHFHKLNGTRRVFKSWYRPDIVENSHPCGSKLTGAPSIRIIYNAAETNRRKH